MSVIEINVDITLKLGISQVKLRHGFESHYFFFFMMKSWPGVFNMNILFNLFYMGKKFTTR